MTKLRLLRWEHLSWIIQVSRVLLRGRQKRFNYREGLSQERPDQRLLALKLEEGPRVKDFRCLRKLEKARKWTPLGSSERSQTRQHLNLSPVNLVSSPDLQNRWMLNSCCLKSLNLWRFVTAAAGNSYSHVPLTRILVAGEPFCMHI